MNVSKFFYTDGFWISWFFCCKYYYVLKVHAFLQHHESITIISDFIGIKPLMNSRQENDIYYSSLQPVSKIELQSKSTLSLQLSRTFTTRTKTSLDARKYSDQRYYDDDDNYLYLDDSRLQRQRITERPPITETRPDTIGPGIISPKPKIVVLGASGKIGRLVIRQLLDMPNLDATIVAFCRDYDKACRVLYDDIIVVERNNKRSSSPGPRLQIIQGNLVPPQILPRRKRNGTVNTVDDEDDDDVDNNDEVEDRQWLKRAESAAKYYGTKAVHYDNRLNNTNNYITNMDSYEALQDAIKDCTVIISCVGAIRITNAWTDYIQFPFWRLFRRDVSHWCTDPNHPYYVHYTSTLKVLQYAEKEQLRRDAAAMAASVTDTTTNGIGISNNHGDDTVVNQSDLSLPPRIRFVRVSDLVCSQQPWHMIPIITNMIQSMIIRYHAMSEKLLQSSTVIDTITIRPGDLTDDVRDESTTNIEINPYGTVDYPSRIGRDDVAATAIAAALYDFTENDSSSSTNDDLFNEDETKTSFMIKQRQQYRQSNNQAKQRNKRPFHYLLACRWTGNELDPYPAQGVKEDGKETAYLSLKGCVPTLRKQSNRRQSHGKLDDYDHLPGLQSSKGKMILDSTAAPLPIVPLPSSIHRRNTFVRQIKPYGICVAIPVYLILIILVRSIILGTIQSIPTLQKVAPGLVTVLNGTIQWIMLVMKKLFHTKFWTVVSISFWKNILNLQRSSPNYISF